MHDERLPFRKTFKLWCEIMPWLELTRLISSTHYDVDTSLRRTDSDLLDFLPRRSTQAILHSKFALTLPGQLAREFKLRRLFSRDEKRLQELANKVGKKAADRK